MVHLRRTWNHIRFYCRNILSSIGISGDPSSIKAIPIGLFLLSYILLANLLLSTTGLLDVYINVYPDLLDHTDTLWQIEAAITAFFLPLLILLIGDFKDQSSLPKTEMLVRKTSLKLVFILALLITVLSGLFVFFMRDVVTVLFSYLLFLILVVSLLRMLWITLFLIFHPSRFLRNTSDMITKDLIYHYNRKLHLTTLSDKLRSIQDDSEEFSSTPNLFTTKKVYIFANKEGIILGYRRWIISVLEWYVRNYIRTIDSKYQLHLDTALGRKVKGKKDHLASVIGTDNICISKHKILTYLTNMVYKINKHELTFQEALLDRLSFLSSMISDLRDDAVIDEFTYFLDEVFSGYLGYIQELNKYYMHSEESVRKFDGILGSVINEEIIYSIFNKSFKILINSEKYNILFNFVRHIFGKAMYTYSNSAISTLRQLITITVVPDDALRNEER